MQIALNTSPAHRHEGVDGRMIYCALLPLFVLAEGGRRLVAGLRHEDENPTRGALLAEAQSQASVAASYALMARSMLHSSERRHCPERLS